MSADDLRGATPSPCPPIRPPLALRVRGGPRDGQLIKVAAAKCTIGSSPGCTLRLRGKDVRPVHCLIVRGKTTTVVRRWSADTLHNGGSFDDRPLLVGDRLRCGPVEFEVVLESGESIAPPATGSVAAPEPSDVCRTQVIPRGGGLSPTGTVALSGEQLPSAQSPFVDAANGDAAMTVAIERGAGLGARTAGSGARGAGVGPVDPTMTVAMSRIGRDAGSERRSAELDTREAKLGEREESLAQREQSLTQRENSVEQRDKSVEQREHLVQEREQLLELRRQELDRRQQEIDRREQDAARRENEVKTLEQEADSRLAAAAEHKSPPVGDEELAEVRRQLEEEREQFAREKREFEAQRAIRVAEHDRWKEDHRQWKAQRQAAESQMEGLQAQVEHQLAEILARRKQIDQDRDAWKTESEQHRRQLEERAADVARQAEELETWRKQLDAEREKAAALIEETSRYEQTCTELADARNRLAQRDAEITSLREELSRYEAEVARLAADLSATVAGGIGGGASAARQASADADPLGQREKKLERQAEELLQLSEQLDRERAEFDARVRAFEAAAEPHPVEPSGEAPSSGSADDDRGLSGLSTWALLKDKIDFTDDESQPRPAKSSPPAAAPAGDDQETIQRYMENLMQRVGGKSTQPHSASEPAAPTTPEAAATASAAVGKPAAAAEARPRPVQRSAKTVTPEEVAAMRELANLNTRVAITKHGARRMIPDMIGKATMGVAALGGAAYVFLVDIQHDVRYVTAGATSAVVGAFFLARTCSALRQIMASRRAAPLEGEPDQDDVGNGK